jgi:hypothetical protein
LLVVVGEVVVEGGCWSRCGRVDEWV